MQRFRLYLAPALILVLVGSLFSLTVTIPQSYASHNNIQSVELDNTVYGQGDDVVISGSIDDVGDDQVTIRITKAGGGSETKEVDVENNGDFEYVYGLSSSAKDGLYTIRVTYESESVYSYFLVDEDRDPVVVELDDQSYQAGGDVEISGRVRDMGDVDEVEITVLDPTNDAVLDSRDENLDDDEFSYTFGLDDDAEHGRYAVTVTYDDDDAGYAIFDVEDDDGGSGGNSDAITVTFSKTVYKPGDTVRMEGEVEDYESGEKARIVIEDSDDNEVQDEDVEVETSGSFEFAFALDDDAKLGEYTVTVTYNGDEVTSTFDVTTSGSSSGGSSSSSGLTIVLDKSSYSAGETMAISGKVPKILNDVVVNVDVFTPDGLFAGVFTTAQPKSDLTYSATLKLKSDLEVDEGYSVQVNYGTYENEKEFAISGRSANPEGITVKTDKDEYEIGATVKISGTISQDSLIDGQKLLIRVNKPDGNPYRIDLVDVPSSGSYTYNVVIGGELATSGQYEVVATYGDEKKSTEFVMTGPPQATKYSLKVEGKSYPIEYEIDGGIVKSMFVQPSDNKLVVSIDAKEDGRLILVLPRDVIDSVEGGSDKKYVVATADLEAGIGNNVNIRESDTTEDTRTIVIDYKAGTDLIEISGTSVVPEFGTVSAIVLAVAIVGIIVASARFQKFSFLR